VKYVSIPDNAALTLRNLLTVTCALSPTGNGGGGNPAALTVFALQWRRETIGRGVSRSNGRDISVSSPGGTG
jgi:hypothetical protein